MRVDRSVRIFSSGVGDFIALLVALWWVDCIMVIVSVLQKMKDFGRSDENSEKRGNGERDLARLDRLNNRCVRVLR